MASGRRGLWGVCLGAFLESSIIPFPFEVILVGAILSDRSRAWYFATSAVVGCLLASAALYGMGALLSDAIGMEIASLLGMADALGDFRDRLEDDAFWQGFWLIFAISFLPLPLQAATLGGGLAEFPFFPFLAAIALSRSLRFHGLTAITLLAGPRIARLDLTRSRGLRTGIMLASLSAGLLVGLLLLFR